MYEPLSDPCPEVRSCCLGVLTHLVLGGRLKAKGSVAKLARLLVDGDGGEGAWRGRFSRMRVPMLLRTCPL
jgi:hypothetical protein